MTKRHTELKQRIRGVMAFSPTPFTQDDRVDVDGLARHVDFLCRSGAHVVVVCGGVGEFFALDMAEYRACIAAAVEAAGGQVPLLVGVGHSTRMACQLAEYASQVGADGLMVHPFYFVSPSEEGIIKHYAELGRVGLGMMIYHTKEAVYSPTLIERLAEIDAVVALKDEYGDLKLFVETKERLGDRLAWVNGMAEALLGAYLGAGAQAMTSGIVNFAPRLSLDVWEAGMAGDSQGLQTLVATKVRLLARLRERRKGYAIAVVKEAMNLLGLPGGTVRAPLLPMLPADREELRQTLVALSILQ